MKQSIVFTLLMVLTVFLFFIINNFYNRVAHIQIEQVIEHYQRMRDVRNDVDAKRTILRDSLLDRYDALKIKVESFEQYKHKLSKNEIMVIEQNLHAQNLLIAEQEKKTTSTWTALIRQ